MKVSCSFSEWNSMTNRWDLKVFRINVQDFYKVLDEVKIRLKEKKSFRLDLFFRFEDEKV